ncbi:MAG: hypothetical protein ACOH16_11965 [Propionibacteriaceae bacterium]
MADLLNLVLDWGFLALSVGAVGVGILLTRGRVRVFLVVALVLFLLQLVLGGVLLPAVTEAQLIGYSVVRGLLSLGVTGAFVAAAVTGAREATATSARIAALTEETPPTWAQPEGSPDPRLLAD